MTTAAVLTDDHVYLDEHEMEIRYRVSGRSLQRWRSSGKGPPFVRIGPRRVLYCAADVEEWLTNRTFTSRADELSCNIAFSTSRKHTGPRVAEANKANSRRRASRQPAKETLSPTFEEKRWLVRIKRSSLCVSHGSTGPRFSLEDGTGVPAPIARGLIDKGLVEPRGDGLFDESQTYCAVGSEQGTPR